MVYIREAHPSDGWQMESNRKEQIEYAQPQTLTERTEVATACALGLKLAMPTLIDTMENVAETTYQAWPERLFVLSTDGHIAYQGGKGPFHFDPEELGRFLAGDTLTAEADTQS